MRKIKSLFQIIYSFFRIKGFQGSCISVSDHQFWEYGNVQFPPQSPGQERGLVVTPASFLGGVHGDGNQTAGLQGADKASHLLRHFPREKTGILPASSILKPIQRRSDISVLIQSPPGRKQMLYPPTVTTVLRLPVRKPLAAFAAKRTRQITHAAPAGRAHALHSHSHQFVADRASGRIQQGSRRLQPMFHFDLTQIFTAFPVPGLSGAPDTCMHCPRTIPLSPPPPGSADPEKCSADSHSHCQSCPAQPGCCPE